MKNTLSKLLILSLFAFIAITHNSSAVDFCDGDCPPPTPTANPVVITTNEDTSVAILLSADNPSERSFSYVIVSGPATGTISTLDGNSLVFTPSLNFYTSDRAPVTFVFGVVVEGIVVSTSTVSVTVNPINDSPVIVLLGDNPATVVVGTEYVDPGATCTDVEDGVLRVIIKTGKIIHSGEGEDSDTPKVGDRYTIYYYCNDSSDSDNDSARTSRVVTVVAVPVAPVPVISNGGGILWAPTVTGNFSGSPIAYNIPISASTPISVIGQVLGASTSCGIYAKDFLRKGADNDMESVKKLQIFLNDQLKAGLLVNGIFDTATENALKAFQTAHADEILKPWQINKATGIFYMTTRVFVNNLMCPALNLPIPAVLVPMSIKSN